MTKVLYTLNASCTHPTQHFAVSQSKVPRNDLMSSLTTSHYPSPQNRFLYSCGIVIHKYFKDKSTSFFSLATWAEIRYCEICVHISFLYNFFSSSFT